MPEQDKDLDRRELLIDTTKVAAKAGVAALVLTTLCRCGANSPGPSVPTDSDNKVALGFTDYPALNNINGSVRVSVKTASGSTKVLSVTRTGSSTAVAVSATCTHSGCTLDELDSSTQRFNCGCHGSVFSVDGSVVSGPASQALTAYSASVTSTGVSITLN